MYIDADDSSTIYQAEDVGDLNGDGLGDLVSAGDAVHVFYGPAWERPEGEAIALDMPTTKAAHGAGDTNGDGYDDVVVYSVLMSRFTGASGFVYVGGSEGLSPEPLVALEALDNGRYDVYGVEFAALGDVDADGHDDLSLYVWSGNFGYVAVHPGSPSGSTAGEFLHSGLVHTAARSDRIWGPAIGLGDLDGDGFDDVAVRTYHGDSERPSSWGHHVFLGDARGLGAGPEFVLDSPDALTDSHDHLRTGDVNGDGYADHGIVDIGDTYTDLHSYHGGAGAPRTVDGVLELGVESSAHILAAGDLDADGFEDLVVADEYADEVGEDSGAAYVLFGSASGLEEPELVLVRGTMEGDRWGYGASAPGDIDGDGLDDIVLSARWAGPGTFGSPALAQVTLGDCEPHWNVDSDGDGFGDPLKLVYSRTQPDDAVLDRRDCDDARADVNPGADEVCADGVDNNCDLRVDPYASWRYLDRDRDGHGSRAPGDARWACFHSPAHVTLANDCDDSEPEAWSGREEYCDGVDNDCDGVIDPASSVDAVRRYRDQDGDGFGDASTEAWTCDSDPNQVSEAGDCDDTDAAVNPAGEEACDGRDQDCDGRIDEYPPDSRWYLDADGDGWGNTGAVRLTCDPLDGWVRRPGDCDDSDPARSPGASDSPWDRLDSDCDGKGCGVPAPVALWPMLLAIVLIRGRSRA